MPYQVFVREFLKREKGHIINIGSIAGREAYAGGSIYNATKFAVHAFGSALMKELVATPIRVSEVQPGTSCSLLLLPESVGLITATSRRQAWSKPSSPWFASGRRGCRAALARPKLTAVSIKQRRQGESGQGVRRHPTSDPSRHCTSPSFPTLRSLTCTARDALFDADTL